MNKHLVRITLLLAACILHDAPRAFASPPGEIEKNLIRTALNTATDTALRENACRRLALTGTEKAAEALMPLLSSTDMHYWARYTMAAIPGPVSDRILIRGLTQTQDPLLVCGLLNTLADRRAFAAVDAIRPLFTAKDTGVRRAALRAMGHMGTRSALKALESISPEEVTRLAWEEALLQAALTLEKSAPDEAERVYRRLLTSSLNPAGKGVALSGLGHLGKLAPSEWRRALASEDRHLREAALMLALREDASSTRFTFTPEEFKKVPVSTQAQLLSVLAMRGSATVRPLLPAALADGDDVLRTAAAQAAGALGDAASVDILIRMAGEEDPPGKAAREALGRIPDPRVASLLLEQFQTGEIPARILALHILVTRGYLPVLDDLFDARLFDVPEMAKATTTALRALCSAETFPRALSVLAELAPEKKPVLISALGRIAQNMGNDARAVEQTQKTMEASSEADRGHLLVIFAALQGDASLKALGRWLTSDSPSVRKETIRTLGKWNNAQSAELLLEAAQKDPDPALRVLAIRSLLAVLQKRGATQTPQEGVALLKRMLPVAECLEEKRAIISCLTGFTCQEALDWATSLVNNEALRTDATAALKELAK